MGFRCARLPAFEFCYRARVGPTLREHEHDSIFVGSHSGQPTPNPSEVADWRYSLPAPVRGELRPRPNRYAIWLRLLLADRFGQLRDGARGLPHH